MRQRHERYEQRQERHETSAGKCQSALLALFGGGTRGLLGSVCIGSGVHAGWARVHGGYVRVHMHRCNMHMGIHVPQHDRQCAV